MPRQTESSRAFTDVVGKLVKELYYARPEHPQAERALPDAVARAINRAGYLYVQREVRLSRGGRIDMAFPIKQSGLRRHGELFPKHSGLVGVELKVGALNHQAVHGQVERYLQAPELVGVILVTERHLHNDTFRIANKHFAQIALFQLWGVTV